VNFVEIYNPYVNLIAVTMVKVAFNTIIPVRAKVI